MEVIKVGIITVLFVGDATTFLATLTALLHAVPRLRVVAMARSGAEALSLVARQSIDLVLLDMGLPDMHGLDLARCLKARPAAPRVIMLLPYAMEAAQVAAKAAGADTVVIKAVADTLIPPLLAAWFPIDDSARA